MPGELRFQLRALSRHGRYAVLVSFPHCLQRGLDRRRNLVPQLLGQRRLSPQ